MRRFTKEELEQLKPAEQHFYTAIKGGFKRATGTNLDERIAAIYNQTDPAKKLTANASCGLCSFNLYNKVGEKYYEDSEYYLNSETVKIEEITPDEQPVEIAPVGNEPEPVELIAILPDGSVIDPNNKATNKDKEDGKKTRTRNAKSMQDPEAENK